MKFDKTKPYGLVSGVHAAAFEQDGVLFDAEGREVVEELVAGTEATDSEATKGNQKAPVDEQIAAASQPKKRGPKAAAKKASPVDEQIAAQAGV